MIEGNKTEELKQETTQITNNSGSSILKKFCNSGLLKSKPNGCILALESQKKKNKRACHKYQIKSMNN